MRASTVSGLVKKHMEGDPAARLMLARGVLSVRSMARWLIEARGWDVSEEAVVSALRRYTGRGHARAEAHAVFGDAEVRIRSDVCLVTAERTPDLDSALGAQLVSPWPRSSFPPRMFVGPDIVSIVLDAPRLHSVLSLAPKATVEHDLAQCVIELPAPSRRNEGTLFTLCSILAEAKLQPIALFATGRDIVVLVDAKSARAIEALFSRKPDKRRERSG